tara:strand:- start:184 stop:1011 length:828 start_codon:yes stop_codon:yes gene_type:complete
MRITKVITSINDNSTYKDFVPLVSKIWKKLFGLDLIIGYVSPKSYTDPEVKKLSLYGDIRMFAPIERVCDGVQAKVTRMYLASSEEFLNENCMIVDIDMLPLTTEVLDVFEKVPEHRFVKWGVDHPAFSKGGPDEGKWPMDRTTALGSLFKEIINPHGLEYEELLHSWEGIHHYGKEDILLPFNQFSDESLLRYLYEKWSKKDTHTHILSRLLLEEKMLCRRLDRVNLTMWQDLPTKLTQKTFIEVHGIRPLRPNLAYYTDILNYFNIKEREVLL